MAKAMGAKAMVSLEEIVLSRVYERDDLLNILERKGMIAKAEVAEDIGRLREQGATARQQRWEEAVERWATLLVAGSAVSGACDSQLQAPPRYGIEDGDYRWTPPRSRTDKTALQEDLLCRDHARAQGRGGREWTDTWRCLDRLGYILSAKSGSDGERILADARQAGRGVEDVIHRIVDETKKKAEAAAGKGSRETEEKRERSFRAAARPAPTEPDTKEGRQPAGRPAEESRPRSLVPLTNGREIGVVRHQEAGDQIVLVRREGALTIPRHLVARIEPLAQ